MQSLAQVSGVPFLQTAVSESVLVLNEIQMTKMNQGRLLPIVELIHQLLSTIIHLCVTNEGVLPLKLLGNIGDFAQTLQNLQNSLKFQQELGSIRRFIRQHEISTQFQTYETELQTIANELKAKLIEFELDAQQRHRELMAVLAAQNDGKSLEYSDSLRGSIFCQSNNVFSVLPPFPKIFHGRDSELTQLVTSFSREEPTHMAILGPGGMGKTTLAIAALHHPEIISKYDRRHFISCESALEKNQLVRIIGDHLGLEPSKQLSEAILRHFGESGSALLVLDNLETTWEPVERRAEVEDLLSLLSELPQLRLLITMRGAERPSKVKWTRPFLPPLDPLPPAASRQTFVEIADDPSSDEELHLTELLDLSGHLPLVVNLMANVASYEGYSKTLLRWKAEKTALLSAGSDKRSNLETSITTSLSSQRMLSFPHTKELLSLLSLLPDGISYVDLLSQEAVDIPNILKCRAVLLRTSLAYIEHGRLKALNPIREYVMHVHPPSYERVERLRHHWDALLGVWKSHKEQLSKELISRLRSNLGNIHSVTQFVLSRTLSGADRQGLMYSILSLDLFSQTILKGKSLLTQHVVDHIQASGDRRLHWQHICSCLDLADYRNLSPVQAEVVIRQGIEYFDQEKDPAGQADFYKVAARYHYLTGNLPKALQFCELGMTSTETKNIREQLGAVNLKTDLHDASISYSGIRLTNEQAAAHWTITKLRHTSDLCKIGREILVTYGHQGSSREVNVLDIEAGIKFEKSEYDEARTVYEAVVRMTDLNRHPYFHVNALFNLVKIDLAMGREEVHVLHDLAVAKQTATNLGWLQGILFSERLMAGVQLVRGETAMALEGYTQCFDSYRRVRMLPGAIQCLEMLADLRHGMCDLEDTFRWAGRYLALVRVYKNLVPTYQALRCLGDIFLAQGDTETALNIFYAVLERSTEMDIHRRRADCMSRIGDIFIAQGNMAGARKMWEDARPLFLRSTQMKDVASIDARLAQFLAI
ncbi:hypothetical protein C8R44DRAFT_881413 [Mycena epipterygia]|nr:hypothetical protein C8R44DRAFT_881413 [Mycena epipterygia]